MLRPGEEGSSKFPGTYCLLARACERETASSAQYHIGLDGCGALSIQSQQRRHLFAQEVDLLVRLAQVRQQAQVVEADRAAAEQPGADAEQLVQLYQLAI